ncbi:uncharacterized protein NPIL_118471 [Nephila pilipes]|uniref:Uncharacterized protein n=1 Tax=Nephila pilipes TaxID=299642 RepID=A0A8X6TNN1_NEPPI|nr:uncharacterized protein NPIL_118471 [Nephila pilipes]
MMGKIHGAGALKATGRHLSKGFCLYSHLKAILHPMWSLGIYVTCYSTNLHLNDDAESETHEIDLHHKGFNHMHYFHLEVGRAESFAPWIPHTVEFFVNSPFVPVSFKTESNRLKYGCTYEVYVSLEEEHLLPEPYHTNCTDYEALWEKNNRTGPRSQENVLLSFSCLSDVQGIVLEIVLRTVLRLFVGFESVPTTIFMRDRDHIRLHVFVGSPEVRVMSHNPLYKTGELFSYVGGLMGCWLGISVWASVGILEKFFMECNQVKQLFRRKMNNCP